MANLPPKKPTVPAKPIQKSGDSKLQDAQAARQKALRGEEGGLESVHAQIQDSVEQRKAAGTISPEEARQKEDALARMMKICEALEEGNKKLAERLMAVERRPGQIQGPSPQLRCSTCFQITKVADGRGVCDGTHVTIKVVPQNMSLWKNFQGIDYNGVKYANTVRVPPSIANEVLSMVYRWEQKETQLMIPGGKILSEVDVRSASIGNTPIL